MAQDYGSSWQLEASPSSSSELGGLQPRTRATTSGILVGHPHLCRSHTAHEARDRTCGIGGQDAPVLLLSFMQFALPCALFACHTELLVCYLAALSSIVPSMICMALNWQRGERWRIFSLLCCISSTSGFAVGILIRELQPASLGAYYCVGLLLTYLLVALLLSHLLPEYGFGIIGSSVDCEKGETDSLSPIREDGGIVFDSAVAAHMMFGIDKGILRGEAHASGFELVKMKVHPREMVLSLLHRRCFWSGEPTVDYAFHVANEHTFLGCLFCHPVHPYDKSERVLVLILQAALTVFPVALLREVIGLGWTCTCLTCVLVTIPRFMLKAVLKEVVLVEDKIRLRLKDEDVSLLGIGHVKSQIKESKAEGERSYEFAFRTQMMIFSALILFTICVSFLCCLYIKCHSPLPLTDNLWGACIGLVYAFVLDLVYDLIIPRKNRDDTLAIGYFDKWYWEKQNPDTEHPWLEDSAEVAALYRAGS